MRKYSSYLIIIVFCFSLIPQMAFAESLVSSQSGFPGQVTQFGFVFANSDTKTHNYAVQTRSLPQGFAATWFQSKQVIQQVKLLPGQMTELTLQVAIPMDAKQGGYQFQATMFRDDNHEDLTSLSLHIDNSFLLKIVSSSSNLAAFSGKNVTFPISVSNLGQKELTGIKLKLDLPHKWQATVAPDNLGVLKAGATANYQVKVSIPPTQDAGNQKITIIAQAEQAKSEAVNVMIETQKGANYLVLPIAAVIIILIGAVMYFKKQGRR